MNAFRFPLQKVLDWRRTQLEMEEHNFRRQAAQMAGLDRASAQMTASGSAAERQVRAWNPVAGGELSALGSFRLHVKLKETELALSKAECRKELARRENLMLEARRRLRLLERLREKRLAEWTGEQDRELEALASEAYLAKWKRRRE
jgi:hypothetical protein